MKRILHTLGTLLRRPPVVGMLVLCAVWAVVMGLRVKGRLQYLELKIYDQLLVSQPRDTRAADRVVVVGIDEVDLRAMKRTIISDRLLDRLINRLHDLGAAAIGIDLFRDQPEGDSPADRKALIETILATHTFCVERPGSHSDDMTPPPDELCTLRRDAKGRYPMLQVTTCEMPWDAYLLDQEARRGLLYVPMSDKLWGSLSERTRSKLPANDRLPEFSLNGAVVNYYLRHPGAGGVDGDPWHWSLPPVNPGADPAIDEADPTPWRRGVVARFLPNQAAYVDAEGQGATGYQYLVDFRGPDVRPEVSQNPHVASAKPGDSVELCLRQVLDHDDLPGWDALTPNERHLPLETDDPEHKHNLIRGRIVFVGSTAVSVKDYVNCPRDAYFRGVEYHALQADQLLRLWKGWAQPRRFLSHRWSATYILLWGIPGVLLGYWAGSTGRVAVYGSAAAAVLAALTVVAFHFNWWLPSLPPAMVFAGGALLMTAYASQHERAERAVVDNLFRRTAGAQVVTELWARRNDIFEHGRLLPRTCTATVLFIDFEGFSRRTEALASPERLIEWLERTLRAMTAVTLASGGTILRYMGDSFEAVFGAPVYRTTPGEIAADAAAAMGCALALRDELGRLNAAGAARGEPPLRMRIGVNTGPVAVGTIGGGTRIEYAVLGDTTNVASRMESCLKDRMGPDVVRDNCRILVSQATYNTACDAVGDRFAVYCIGPVQIHNHSDVVAYAVLGTSAPAVHRQAPALATA